MPFNELQTNEEFLLTAPEGEVSDQDSLGELSTGSIEIEIEDYCGEDYCGYEDYEPNVYDGTYSEM